MAHRPSPLPSLVTLAVALVATAWSTSAQEVRLPNAAGSVKFAVIGDMGTGDPPEFQVADQMVRFHKVFPFTRVIMLGDNIYGGQSASDLDKKFAKPYKALLDAGIPFYASLGNHDSQANRNYPPFHMDGQRYYSNVAGNIRFIALDTDSLDPAQVTWLEGQLRDAKETWKIVYFHHPLYSDGKTHGSDVDLRVVLEPLFVKYGVNVVLSGHDHIYERITPQKGIYYFVSGSAGQLRKGDLQRSAMTAAGFDDDCTFMLVEVSATAFAFETVTRTGQIVDSGTLPLQAKKAASPGAGEHR